jgi:hypothetical protein
MLDERGVDYGALTGVGLVIASAVVLLFIFSLLRSSAPANTAIALEAAASEVCGDVETVASMAIPYRAERYYGFDGINVSVSADRVTASAGSDVFSRPLVSQVVPGEYEEDGFILWNGTAGMRERLNASFNATGTKERPIDDNRSGELRRLMEGASRSTLLRPIEVRAGKPLTIEKTFVYTYNGSTHAMEARPYVLVYRG